MKNQTVPWLMLLSRSILFIIAQALIAFFLSLNGSNSPWTEAAHWWIFFPIFANLVSIALLVYCFRAEGKCYLDILRFSGKTWKTDLLWFIGSGIVGIPIAAAPMGLLGAAIFGDPMVPNRLLFQPLPTWALIVGLLFPLTIGFAELPTYFGYVMPRLFCKGESQTRTCAWLAYFVAVAFLAIQHIFLPFIMDGRYLLWRGLMFLPFALYGGLMVKLRPNLLPYFAIVHALMDVSVLGVYLTL